MKITFKTASGSTYLVDTDEGTLHRDNVKTLRGIDGELIPGSGWKINGVAVIFPSNAIIPVVGSDKPIVTTQVVELEVSV